jgi:hypothetical protein
MAYYSFQSDTGEPYGSCEVFFTCGSFDQEAEDSHAPGWYWQACFPGCLPDSDPCGPFQTKAEAMADADVVE